MSESFSDECPFLKKFGGMVMSPLFPAAKGCGFWRLKRFDNAYEMVLWAAGNHRGTRAPIVRLHQIGEKF